MYQHQKEAKQKYSQLSAKYGETKSKENYKFILLKGNNHPVVEKVMERRNHFWEKENSTFSKVFHLKWTPISRQITFDLLSKHGQKQLVNHFCNHGLLTTKDCLFNNLL
jgi:gluconate kinase